MTVRLLLCMSLLAGGCVVRRIERPKGTQSFRVTVVKPEDSAALGSRQSPLPYASNDTPFAVTFRLEAIGWDGQPDAGFTGRLVIAAHPGLVFPNEVNIHEGTGEVSVRLANSYGETRIWFEDCGIRELPFKKNCTLEERQAYVPECFPQFRAGTLATGISPPIVFAQPALSDVQETGDNASSPLMPIAGDRCAALADPRYVDTTNLTPRQINQLPRAQRIPASGNTVRITAGELIVTAIDNGGFFVTDVSPEAQVRGFNSIYVFAFSYPENLQVGDRVLSLTGTPAEFVGATQLNNPFWIRDSRGPYPEKLPAPYTISPQLYQMNIGTAGGNVYNELSMEKLEGSLVCMDNLGVPSGAENCDLNNDGGLTRGSGSEEQACETKCYDNPDCFEASGYFSFGNWGAHVTGITSGTHKVGMELSAAFSDFRPDIYQREPWKYDEAAKEGDAPQRLAVIGNLIHVLGARPVWVIQPRGRDDVRFGGTCP